MKTVSTLLALMFRLVQRRVTEFKPAILSNRNMSKIAYENGTSGSTNCEANRSIHSSTIGEVHNVPLNIIIRPFPPVLDELKVQSLMDTIKVT